MMRIHHMLDPETPEVAVARAIVWSAVMSHPKSFMVQFKHRGRWIRAVARPSGDLTFAFLSNHKPVPASWVPGILLYLISDYTPEDES
jgi:hypothetical protein